MSTAERPGGRSQNQQAGRPVESGSPLSPVQAPLRSQVSSLMDTSPRNASGISPFTSPQRLGSLAPAVLPGMWRRASLPAQLILQQQMSSLGQQYLPQDKLAQLMSYGSALNLPGQVEDTQSVSVLNLPGQVENTQSVSALKSPGQVEDTQSVSGKIFVGIC